MALLLGRVMIGHADLSPLKQGTLTAKNCLLPDKRLLVCVIMQRSSLSFIVVALQCFFCYLQWSKPVSQTVY